MSLYGDTRFRGASKASTPQFAAAAGMQSQLENEAKQQENSQISNNVMGAGKLYNEAMGDNTPLADMAAAYFGTDESGVGGQVEMINALRGGGMPAYDSAAFSALTDEEIAQALAQQQAAAAV